MTDETALIPVRDNPHDAIDSLIARVRAMPGRRKRRAGFLSVTMLVTFFAAMVWLGTAGYLDTIWPMFAALALTCGPGIWIWMRAERREMRTIEELAACREFRVLGGLLESMDCSNRRARNAVQATLLELLPRLTEEHSALLSTGHREVLNALLYGKSGGLAMAALAALEKVGDGTALPYLTSIAAGKGVPGTLRDRQPEVQERARHAVEMIRERIEMQNRASVLLRASQVPGTPPEQLVRPAHRGSLVNAQELLRPEVSAEQDSVQKEDML